MSERSLIGRFFDGVGRAFGWLRRILQFFALVIFVLVLVAVFSGGPRVTIPESAALVIEPTGFLVEEIAIDPIALALGDLQGLPVAETRMRDLLLALERAADDPRIQAVVLELGGLQGGGLAKLETLADAVSEFRDSGKPVLAIGDGFTQEQYYLAAAADQIYMNPLGSVYLDGYGYFRAFFREGLELFSIDVNVFRAGEFKSFVEPFERDDMSAADRTDGRRWLEALWQVYLTGVEQARDLPPGSVTRYINGYADAAETTGGDLAGMAVAAGLVDELRGRREFNADMAALVGDGDGGYAAIGHRAYLSATEPEAAGTGGPVVGVLVASGTIVDGPGLPGQIGGESLAREIRAASEDPDLDALVLRIDSPGGSLFASELIHAELQALRDSGKPLVASMGTVAASGGYYIAAPADEIWAEPATITGSIGVFALLPTFQRGLERLGVRIDGFGTTPLSGQMRPDRALGDDARRIIQASVEEAYRLFTGRVMQARPISAERIEGIAQGRIWTGEDALSIDLVDNLGSLEDAVAAAAGLAGAEGDDYATRFLRRPPTMRERLTEALAVRAWATFERVAGNAMPVRGHVNDVIRRVEDSLSWLSEFNDPGNLYLLCPCDLR